MSLTPIQTIDLCPVCERQNTFLGKACSICKLKHKKIFLDGLIVASFYDHPVIKEAVHFLKYRFVRNISISLSKILYKKLIFEDYRYFRKFTISTVPLHPERKEWRGFNQSELLAQDLVKLFRKRKNINFKLLPDLLQRIHNSLPQMKINDKELRTQNVKKAFVVNKKYLTNLPEKVILIDDVATTGSTLNECAKALKKKGVKKVWGLVVARQKI